MLFLVALLLFLFCVVGVIKKLVKLGGNGRYIGSYSIYTLFVSAYVLTAF